MVIGRHLIGLNLCFPIPLIFGPNKSQILSMFLRLPLRIRLHCLIVFHGSTFNALLPLCSIDNNLVRLFCLLPPLYPEFLINSTFHSFGSLMPKTWKVEDQHDRGFQRWILTTERFCGSGQYNCKDGARPPQPSFYPPPARGSNRSPVPSN